MPKQTGSKEALVSPSREAIIRSTLVFRRTVAKQALKRKPEQTRNAAIQRALQAHRGRLSPVLEEVADQASFNRRVNHELIVRKNADEQPQPWLWFVAGRVIERKAEVLGKISAGAWLGSRYMGFSEYVPRTEIAELVDPSSEPKTIETALIKSIAGALEATGLGNLGVRVDDFGRDDGLRVAVAMPLFNDDKQPFAYRGVNPNDEHRGLYGYQGLFNVTTAALSGVAE